MRITVVKLMFFVAGSLLLAFSARATSVRAGAPLSMRLLTPYAFNVKDYGAQGNGKANDAPAINKAIAAATSVGGGMVVVPAGIYLCGSIRMQSNINLVLTQGAVIEAIKLPEAYDKAEPNESKYQDFGHSHWHNGLIWGENLENISITGPGMIHGKGLSRNIENDKLPPGLGDKAIAFKLCRNVLLRDFTVLHGGHFAVLATGIDNMNIDNLKIDTQRDGIDLDCCRNVRVSNCSINTPFDDAICPKSSFALGYARATEAITITNCIISAFREGTMLDATYKPMDTAKHATGGRIKMGTESNGGFKNITISNCVFDHSQGIALETVDGAIMEDISISNITMRDVNYAPFHMRLGSRMRGPEGTPVGGLKRINISDVVIYNANRNASSMISGIPGHFIEDVKISNVRIVYEGGGTSEDAAVKPPERENGSPDPPKFGTFPTYAFYIRHVDGIEFTNIKISYKGNEARPPFMLEDVKNADFRYIKATHASGVPSFVLDKVSNFSISESASLPDKHLFSTEHAVF